MAEALEATRSAPRRCSTSAARSTSSINLRDSTTCARAWRSRSPSTPLRRSRARATTSSIILRSQDGYVQSRSTPRTKDSRWRSGSACVRLVQFDAGRRAVSAVRAGTMGRGTRAAAEAFLADSMRGQQISARLVRALIRLGRDDPAGALADTGSASRKRRALAATRRRLPVARRARVRAGVDGRHSSRGEARCSRSCSTAERRAKSLGFAGSADRPVDVGAGRTASALARR